MSHTDKTTPWRVVHARGDCRDWGYPCKCVSISRRVHYYREKYMAKFRAQLRVDLAANRDPETHQHRHRALWDAS